MSLLRRKFRWQFFENVSLTRFSTPGRCTKMHPWQEAKPDTDSCKLETVKYVPNCHAVALDSALELPSFMRPPAYCVVSCCKMNPWRWVVVNWLQLSCESKDLVRYVFNSIELNWRIDGLNRSSYKWPDKDKIFDLNCSDKMRQLSSRHPIIA